MTPSDFPSSLQYTNRRLIKDIWQFIRPYKWRFVFGSLLRLIGDLSALYPAYALAAIVTFFTTWQPGDPLQPVWIYIYIWLIFFVTYNLGHWGGKHIGFLLAEKTGTDVLNAGLEKLTALDARWHEKEASGSKIKRIQRGRDAANKILRIWFTNVIQIVVDFSVTLVVMAVTDLLTGAIFAFLIISYTALAFIFTKPAARAAHAEGIEEERTQGLAFDLVGNIRTVRALNIGPHLVSSFGAGVAALYDKIRQRVFWFRMQSFTIAAWYGLYKIAVFAFIMYGISQGRFEVGFLVLFNGYSVRIRESSSELVEISQDYVIAKNNLWRFAQTMHQENRKSLKAAEVFPAPWNALSVQNLRFSYNPGYPVLNSISFRVNRGQRIGIVGSSGAGKSTIFKLLLKEYEDFEGTIQIDKTPIQAISELDYFGKVAVVLQDTEVFNLTLRENIIAANPKEADNEQLFDHAVSVSYVKDFVERLPQGYDTVIGERGFKLSGGERQRLGIARAIFKKPEILLLDEATSHLDLESEEKIRDSLHKVFQHMTALVIAHRLTTIREMDHILVVESGKIVEEGSFATLHAHQGRFYELWEKQRL